MPYATASGAARTRSGDRGASSAAGAKVADRRRQAFDLRRQRWSYREIAVELGIAEQTAYALVRAEFGRLDAATTEDARLVRAMECERLDEIERALVTRITNPNRDRDGNAEPLAPHVMAILKLQERRARLLGLDAPVQVDVSGTVAHVHFDLGRLDDVEIETLRALVAKATPGPVDPALPAGGAVIDVEPEGGA